MDYDTLVKRLDEFENNTLTVLETITAKHLRTIATVLEKHTSELKVLQDKVATLEKQPRSSYGGLER